MTATTVTSIGLTEGRTVDPAEMDRLAAILARKLGSRRILRRADGVDICLGTSGTRKLILRLGAHDLWDVEVGHVHGRTWSWVIDSQVLGIDTEALADTLRTMCARHWVDL